jgi:hypothetical protein
LLASLCALSSPEFRKFLTDCRNSVYEYEKMKEQLRIIEQEEVKKEARKKEMLAKELSIPFIPNSYRCGGTVVVVCLLHPFKMRSPFLFAS